MLPVEVIGVHEDHLNESGLTEGETKAVGDTGEGREGVFEVDEVAFFGTEVAFVVLVFVPVDDPAEVDSGQEVLVGLRHLVEHGVRFHVLDVRLDQGSTIPDYLDDVLLTEDCPVDQGILGGGWLKAGSVVVGRLLLSEEGDTLRGHGRKRCCEEKHQRCTGDGS